MDFLDTKSLKNWEAWSKISNHCFNGKKQIIEKLKIKSEQQRWIILEVPYTTKQWI